MEHGQQPTRPGAVRLTVLLLAGAVLASCSGSVEHRRPDGPGVTGRMILLDDTGLPPRPDSGGGILVIPEPALPDLWQTVGKRIGRAEGPPVLREFLMDHGIGFSPSA